MWDSISYQNNENTENDTTQEKTDLARENEELREKVAELTGTLDAIRSGEVDAIVVTRDGEKKIYTLEGADHAYQALVENISEGAVTLSPDGMVLYSNSALAGMMQVPLDRLLGTFLPDHVSPRDRPAFERMLRKAAESPQRGPFNLRRGSRLLPVLISMNTLEISGGKKISVVVADRRHDVRALRASEAKFRNLFEKMAEGFALHEIVCDSEGRPVDYRFLDVNPAFERLTGLERRKVVGKLATAVLPGNDPAWIERYGKVALTGTPDHFDMYSAPLGRHYEVYAYSPAEGQFAVFFIDITDHKKGEVALRESEERFRAVLDGSRDMIYRLDLRTGRYDYVSPSAGTVMGYSPDEIMAMDPQKSIGMLHPDDVDPFLAFLERIPATGTGEIEYRQRTRNGDYRWLSNHMSFIRDDSGRPVFRTGNIRNITDRKNAENAVIGLNQRLQALMEAVPVGIIFSDDPTCERLMGNPTALAQFEVDEGENLSASALDMQAPGRGVRYFQGGRELGDRELPLQRAVSENRVIPASELEIELPGGRRWIASASGAPVRDPEGNVIGGVAVTEDITGRKTAEKAMRENEELFRSFYENSPLGFAFLDPGFRYRYINQRLADIKGLTAGDHVGRTIEEAFPGLWRSAKPVFEQVRDTLRPVPSTEIEGETLARPGTMGYWLESIYPVVMEGGQLLGYGVAILDITERKEAELALRDSEKRLSEASELLDAITMGTDVIIAAQDKNFRYTYFNKAYAEEVKRITGRDLFLGMSMIEAFDTMPGEQKRNIEAWSRVLSGRTLDEKIQFGSPGEGIRTFHVLQTPIRDANGTIIGAGEVAFDITGQLKVEESLREKQTEIEALFNNIPAGLVLFDAAPPYTVLVHNRFYQELFSEPFRSRGMAGLNIYEYAPSVEAEGVSAVFDEVIRTEEPAVKLDFPYRSNPLEQSWYDWYLLPIIVDGKVVSLVSMTIDVTEDHRIGQAVKENQKRLSILFRKAPYPITLTRYQDGVLVDVNDQWERTFGYVREEAVGKTLEDLGIFKHHEEWTELLSLLSGKGTLRDHEADIYTKSRDVLTMSNNLDTFEAGGEQYLVLTQRDITAGRKAEKVLLWNRRRNQILADIAERLLRSEDPQSVIEELCRDTMQFLECDAFFNYMADPEGGRLRLNSYAGIPDEEAGKIASLDYGVAVCECAARDGCRIVSGNIQESSDPRTDLVRSYGIRAYACHPIQIGATVIGTLSFGTRTRPEFSEEELAVMKAVTDYIAIALNRLQTYRDLQDSHDRLTLSERELQETSESLENLITYANAPIIVWDPEFRITRFNQAFEHLTGRRSKDVIGQHIRILFPKNSVDESMDRIISTSGGERWETVEIPILHRDGGTRTVLWNSATVYGPDGTSVASIIAQGQDITERKKAETELATRAFELGDANRKLSEEIAQRERTDAILKDALSLLNASLESTADGICVIDLSGTITNYNSNFLDMWNVDGGLIGSRDSRAVFGSVMDQVKNPRYFISSMEDLSLHPDKEIFDMVEMVDGRIFSRYAKPQKIGDTVVGRLWGFRDITDRKTAEASLVRSLREKEVLLREIHHRVKNNLQIISGLVDMTRMRTEDKSTSTILTDLMLKIQTMAQIHTRLYESKQFGKISLEDHIRDQTESLKAIYSHGGYEITTEIESSGIYLPVDQAIPCGLVINEILSNAFKHAFNGREAGSIRITTGLNDGKVIISVRDDGIGLPDGFDVYATNSLGIKLVRTLVEQQLKGKLSILSRNGTEVNVEFPMGAEDADYGASILQGSER